MIINNNIMAMNTHRQLSITNNSASKSMEKLSSGMRINRAGDDAAGLAISEKMRAQIRGLNKASRNAQDGISLIQTAEGALQETQAILQRMRELAVQAANDTNVETDRQKIQSEIDELAKEITRIANTTEFNTQKLLDGTFNERIFHIGANENQNIDLTINTMKASDLKVGKDETQYQEFADNLEVAKNVSTTVSIEIKVSTGVTAAQVSVESGTVTVTLAKTGTGTNATVTSLTMDQLAELISKNTAAAELVTVRVKDGQGSETVNSAISAVTVTNMVSISDEAGIDVSSQTAANNAIKVINAAINTVSNERAKLGAIQNRLEHTIKNLDTSAENLQASESRIRDVDMAKEMMEFTKQNILQQAATAMLAQANQAPQGVLQLLR